MIISTIQWCHTTVNPTMGCIGCPLFSLPQAKQNLINLLIYTVGPSEQARTYINNLIEAATLSHLGAARERLAKETAQKFGITAKSFQADFIHAIQKARRCYAAALHARNGRNPERPESKGNPGYAPIFEEVTEYPGRTAKVAKLSPPSARELEDKPWLTGLPRLIFVSDMGDSLSPTVSFEYLLREVVEVASSHNGRRHLWLWLTKQPARMVKFGRWLTDQGIAWPDNLVAMTSVIDQKMASSAVNLKRKMEPEPQRD